MSVRAFFTRFMLRHSLRKALAKNHSIEAVRTMGSIAEAGFRLKKSEYPDIRIEALSLGGVTTELVAGEKMDRSRAILYIHGGGWVSCSPQTHRAITWRLAHLTGVPVYAVDYRLAPEHPYPAALNDALSAYEALLARGIEAENIVVAGDSAGGNLTLALALLLKEEKKRFPAALVVLSPVTDLTAGGESFKTNANSDVVFTPDLLGRFAPIYAPDTDLKDPFVSPLFGDVSGLPPTLFQVAGSELLLDDSVRMARKMQEAEVDAVLEVWPGLWHVWQLTADALPEAEEALKKIAEFVKRYLP